jgi:hypothetical protein
MISMLISMCLILVVLSQCRQSVMVCSNEVNPLWHSEPSAITPVLLDLNTSKGHGSVLPLQVTDIRMDGQRISQLNKVANQLTKLLTN